jgi:hypothetical protein
MTTPDSETPDVGTSTHRDSSHRSPDRIERILDLATYLGAAHADALIATWNLAPEEVAGALADDFWFLPGPLEGEYTRGDLYMDLGIHPDDSPQLEADAVTNYEAAYNDTAERGLLTMAQNAASEERTEGDVDEEQERVAWGAALDSRTGDARGDAVRYARARDWPERYAR